MKNILHIYTTIDEDDEADDELKWEAILMMGYGCGLALGYIVFKIGKPWWCVRYIEVLQLKLMNTCAKHYR